MSYLIFARKWRPQTFEEIVGQEHIATTLKNAIKFNRVAQAYLFSGPRGVGKTSTARILAKALNCKEGPAPSPCNKCPNCQEITNANSLDVIEIDGASNRGIDEIRALRENVKFAPVNGRYKIYIIDEVHQITPDGFNALLKTLEEPPLHVKFIFATTQPHKIPATILSRCQRFDFRRLPIPEIVTKLKEVAKLEGIDGQEGIFFDIAKAADGSMRDAESILDQLNSFCDKKIETGDVAKVLGLIGEEAFFKLTELITKRDISSILKMVEDLTNEGKDLFQFLIRFIEYIRNLTVLKINRNLKTALALPDETVEKLFSQSEKFSIEDLVYLFYLLSNSYDAARRTGLIRFSLEFALIKIVRREGIIPIEELLEKVKKLSEPKEDCPAPVIVETQNNNVELPPGREELQLSDIENAWPQIIKQLNAKKASLASFLAEGAPAALDRATIRINFPKMHRFHKEMLEKPENKKIIEGIFREVLKADLKVEFNLVEKLERKNNLTLDIYKEEPKEEKKDDPVVRDAMDVFKGSVIRNHKNFEANG